MELLIMEMFTERKIKELIVCEGVDIDEDVFNSDLSIFMSNNAEEISEYIEIDFKDLIDEAYSGKKTS